MVRIWNRFRTAMPDREVSRLSAQGGYNILHIVLSDVELMWSEQDGSLCWHPNAIDELEELDELKLDLERAEETAQDPGDDQQHLDDEVNRRKKIINTIADKMRGSVRPPTDYEDISRSELVCWYCDQKAEEDLDQAELRQLWCTRCKRPWLFSQLRAPVNDRALPRPEPTPEPLPVNEYANLDRDHDEAGHELQADPHGAGGIEGIDLEVDQHVSAVLDSGTETREEQDTGPQRIVTDSDDEAEDDPEQPGQFQASPSSDSSLDSTPVATGANLILSLIHISEPTRLLSS